jgi:hypothetical protein
MIENTNHKDEPITPRIDTEIPEVPTNITLTNKKEQRKININEDQQKKFCTNEIKTAKYNMYNLKNKIS